MTLAPRLFAQLQQVHDSGAADSIRFDQPPIAGPAARVFRFLFSGVPQWLQVAGVVAGVIVGVAVAILAWRNRTVILAWLASRSRGYKMALGGTIAVVMAAVIGTGAWSYNYMMHVNDFCGSCHVMNTAVGAFRTSEHDKLECHTCHRQSIFASARELYYWVLDRPEKIPPHAPVPNAICGECHLQETADSTWKRISATAGHQVHFKSDSSNLAGIMCVACHGREVHAFKAADQGCAQSKCHDRTEVKLGAMSSIRPLHCVACHEFNRTVSELMPLDSTRSELVPGQTQCFSCHDMREKLAGRGLDKDPHKGNCGTCHNPHDQTRAAGAFASCATAGCHSSPDTLSAFHRGLGTHALDQCGSCHRPHAWKVESTDCLSCHKGILQEPAPARRAEGPAGPADEPAAFLPHDRDGTTGGPRADAEAAWPALDPDPVVPADSLPFSHTRHRTLSCASCHSTRRTHGELLVRSTRDCQGCHHASDQRAGRCDACHSGAELSGTTTRQVPVRVTGRAQPVARTMPFAHQQHERTACLECHGSDAGREPLRTCAECHGAEHRPTSNCSACHVDERATHTRADHTGCARCHSLPAVAALPPSRPLCLSCHPAQAAHFPARECAPCHGVSWRGT